MVATFGWKVLTTLLASSSSSRLAARNSPIPERVTLQVCLSPGCVADGAARTMHLLQALAPAHFVIEEGGCNSLCGYGPVVISPEASNKYKKVVEEKALEILYSHNNDPNVPAGPSKELVRGYELVQHADLLFDRKDYEQAIVLYEQAIGIAFRSAMDLQTARDHFAQSSNSNGKSANDGKMQRKSKYPVGLEWLIRARRNEAVAKLERGDVDGAVLAAQASCNLSRNSSAESFRVLALVYQRKEDMVGELQSLQTMLGLPIDESKLSFQEKNARRLCGFRLQKLELQTKQKTTR
jgi:tetratricopeptide (TPR) repeat protein